jgi:SAM-dependent methyltransferase
MTQPAPANQPAFELPGAGVDVRAFAQRFGGRGNYEYHYIKSKLRMDPLYPAVYEALKGREEPLLDLGCGMGVLAFYLRERGYTAPILGLDYDPRKIRSANLVARAFRDVEFREGDARRPPEDHAGDVTILDILQFFSAADQRAILESAIAAARRSGHGRVIIRSTVEDKSWRYRVSRSGDLFAKLTFWMKDHPTEYPTIESLAAPFREAGFREEIRPLWGNTAFNNYLLVFSL